MIFGIIQAGLTSLVASGVGVYRLTGFAGSFLADWLGAWLASWAMMLPVVVLAAPRIQKMVLAIVRFCNRNA